MKIQRIGTILGLSLLLLAGCGKKAPREISPNERNRLVIRMFQSLERQDAASAQEQAGKFRSLDPGNNYLTTIVDTQRGNACIAEAQKLLDAGRFAAAGKVLENGIKASPLNRRLVLELELVRRLAALDADIKALAAARELNDRSRTLVRIEHAAAELDSPELNAAVKLQRSKLDADIAADLERRRQELEKRNPTPADKNVKSTPAPADKQVP